MGGSSLSSTSTGHHFVTATTTNLITVIGTNFGASGASIYIGNSACTDVTHDVNNPHQQLTCTLPNGNRLNLALVLFQRNGELSESVASVSYSQCQPGITEVDPFHNQHIDV
jgi:hypothetical protein